MKKIIFSSIVMLGSLLANSQITKAELTATGLTCSMCSKATYKQLSSIPEVEKIETDLNKTAFILHFKTGSTINPADLKTKVEDAGFSVGELVVFLKLDNQKAENNSSFVLGSNTYKFIDSKTAVLTGDVKVKILDKGFVTEKEYKKLQKLSKQYPSYASANKNVYHIKPL